MILINKEELQKLFTLEQFPRSAKYNIQWLYENEMGPSSTWLSEFLLENMELKKGMKILDLGCGKALSSIFMAKEFGVQVWATDLWIRPTDNYKRIKECGVEDLIYPVYDDAHHLPFVEEFF